MFGWLQRLLNRHASQSSLPSQLPNPDVLRSAHSERSFLAASESLAKRWNRTSDNRIAWECSHYNAEVGSEDVLLSRSDVGWPMQAITQHARGAPGMVRRPTKQMYTLCDH